MQKTLFLAMATALAASSASAGNIVTNGNFSTGDFTGWTQDTNADVWSVLNFPINITDPGAPSDTSFAATDGCLGTTCTDPVNGDWFSQLLSTDVTQTYTLTFMYDPGALTPLGDRTADTSDPGIELDIFWNGSLVSGGQITGAPASQWMAYSFSGLTATSASTLLEFTGEQTPDTMWLTDISVTGAPASTAAEPASLLLMVGGLFAIGFLRFQRQREA